MDFATLPFSLRQLQYVVAIADELSFRKAALRCRVSQPSLSAQVLLLEECLGVQLFERDHHRVLLTAAGHEVVTRARQLLLGAADVVDAAKRAADPLSGTLRVGVIPTIAPYLLPVLTPLMRERLPRLTVVWIEDKTAMLSARLEQGTLDGALLALESEIGDVERDVIAKDPFVLAAPLDHPLSRTGSDAVLGDLRDASVLLLDDGHCFREQALSFCARAKARELEFRATSLSTLVQMVAQGAGVTLLPALSVATEAQRSELRVRAFAAPAPARTIALVWRKSSPLSAALHTLAQLARDAYPTGDADRGSRSTTRQRTRTTRSSPRSANSRHKSEPRSR
jgi:LysR family hydrogen peroxide-inducible transcriptional activator